MQDRVNKITQILDDKKASNIEEYHFKEDMYFAKAVVICDSLNSRHAHSLLDALKELKPNEEFLNTDTRSDDWIIGDLGDIIVHITSEELRKTYKLDEFFTNITLGKISKDTPMDLREND